MFIAVYINTFQGSFEPYGMFPTKGSGEDWILEMGLKKKGERQDGSLWSVIEVTQVR